MNSRSVRARTRGSKRSDSRTGRVSEKASKQAHTHLLQLVVCLALFLTVYIGKGVFPQRLQQVSGQILDMMGQNTNFQDALVCLGASLTEERSVFGEIQTFCVQVFGPVKEESVPVLMPTETGVSTEQQFLNSAPEQAVMMSHYLRLEEVPEEWIIGIQEQAEKTEPTQCSQVPEVGTVVLEVKYGGPELPEGYTMDQLSLGTLEVATPVMGTLWSEYGYRDHPIDGEYKFHNGVDIGADEGVAIGAFAAGTVEYIGQSDVYGKYLQVDHGQGIKSFYAHCSEIVVQQGQQVEKGTCVARVGATGNATGPHLHFELKCGGTHLDPAHYIEYRQP